MYSYASLCRALATTDAPAGGRLARCSRIFAVSGGRSCFATGIACMETTRWTPPSDSG